MIFDYLKKIKRGPQVLLAKDAAIVLGYCPITKESVVVDAGTGSGYFAAMASRVAKKVISYEKNEEFAALAKKNLEKLKISNVEIKIRDVIKDGFEPEEADVVFLDLPNSSLAIKNAIKILKENGVLVGFFPHIEQLKEFVFEAKKFGWKKNYCLEVICRQILVRETGSRPENTGLLHSGYLTFIEKGEEQLTKLEKKRRKKLIYKTNEKNAEGGI
ncbi:MAG: methyltransferase domain-containing protein [Candidatus Micrarchaeota archaeon]|nr:methyltransferase domain-containing protein [Candidatus Micrarchaeota archaeon]